MKYALTLMSLFIVLTSCRSNRALVIAPEHEAGLLRNQTIDILGEERGYHLYLPGDPSSAPMVLLLHGNRGSSDQLLGLRGLKAPNKKWMDIALQENLLLVVPNGSIGPEGHQGWNDCRSDALGNPETDDVHFISSLIDKITHDYQRAATKVFAVGVSNGGMMSMRLAQAGTAAVTETSATLASLDPP